MTAKRKRTLAEKPFRQHVYVMLGYGRNGPHIASITQYLPENFQTGLWEIGTVTIAPQPRKGRKK